MFIETKWSVSHNFIFQVFDSSNLTHTSAEQFLKSLCNFADLPFDCSAMMSMDSSKSFPSSWWLPPSVNKMRDVLNLDFHSAALSSNHFQDTSKPNNIESLSSDQEKKLNMILEECLPMYEELKKGKEHPIS